MKEWDEQEQRRREQEQLEASLYRSRSRHHGSGLTEEEQEERAFRHRFPLFDQVLASPSVFHYFKNDSAFPQKTETKCTFCLFSTL